MTELVQIGDIIYAEDSQPVSVTLVERGRYGLLVQGFFTSTGSRYAGFHPWELPPHDRMFNNNHPVRRGWGYRATTRLTNGTRVGVVAFGMEIADNAQLDACEAEWEKTLAEWTPEPMGCIPLSELMHETK